MPKPTVRAATVTQRPCPAHPTGPLPAQAVHSPSPPFMKFEISIPAPLCIPMHPTLHPDAVSPTPELQPAAPLPKSNPISRSKIHNLHPHAVTQPNPSLRAHLSLPPNLITFGWRYQKRGFQNPELDHLRLALSKTQFPHKQPDHLRPPQKPAFPTPCPFEPPRRLTAFTFLNLSWLPRTLPVSLWVSLFPGAPYS